MQQWEEEEWDPDFQATILVKPGSFRVIDEVLRQETRGQAMLEVLNVAVVEDDDEELV